MTRNYKVSAFYAHYGSCEPFADYYKGVANPNGVLHARNVHALALNNTITLGPTMLLSVRYGYNSFDDNSAAGSAGFDVASPGFDKGFLNGVVFKKFPRVEMRNALGILPAKLRPVVGLDGSCDLSAKTQRRNLMCYSQLGKRWN